MGIQVPPDPKPEERTARELTPMTILQDGGHSEKPVGVTHPSKSINHSFDMKDETVEYSDTSSDTEPTIEDRTEPLLAEVDPIALQGAAMET